MTKTQAKGAKTVMSRKNYSDYLNTASTSCVAITLISMLLCLQVAIYIIDCQEPKLPPCRNNQTCVLASSDNIGEFVSKIQEIRKTEEIYNICQRTYVPERIITTRYIDVAIRDGYHLSHPNPAGIMAVVQDMDLYVDLNSMDYLGLRCLDYLEFYNNPSASKTCGLFKLSEGINETLGPLSYIAYENGIQISYSQNSAKTISAADSGRSLNIKLTTFYVCPDKETLNGDGKSSLRRCSDINSQSCIPSEYFCDGVINCADFGDGIGWDELNCNGLENFDNSTSVRDLSSELNLMDVLIRPGEKKSAADLVLWILVFIVAPATLLFFMIISVVLIYDKYMMMIKRDRDCKKLRAFLDKTGISPDQLKDIQLAMHPGVKSKSTLTPEKCNHSGLGTLTISGVGTPKVVGVGTANVYPDMGQIIFLEEQQEDAPFCVMIDF